MSMCCLVNLTSNGFNRGGPSLKYNPRLACTVSSFPLGLRCSIITRSVCCGSGQAIPSGATYGVCPGSQPRKNPSGLPTECGISPS